MDVPLKIAFHGVDHSDAAEHLIREAVAKLERIDRRITACRVAIEGRQRGAEKRRLALRVRIDVTLPGAELLVNNDRESAPIHDIGLAARKAFAAMERQLKEHRDRVIG